MAKKFEIFISYRRKGGYDTAKLLYDRLRLDGYAVSFDIDTLEKGDFDDELENRVKICKDFLLVLNPGVFDRFYDPNCNPKDDWVRREIACALEDNKNIVPLFLDGFAYPKEPLPPDVKDITRKNGIDLNPKHFESAYANLKQKFLISQPRWTTKHKKKIITTSILAFLAIAAYLYFAITQNMSKIANQNELEIQLIKKQMADSMARETWIKDSIIKHKDSLAKAQEQLRQQPQSQTQSQKSQPAITGAADKKQTASSSTRGLHWAGSSNDRYLNAIYEKLTPAGVKKTSCSDNGIKITPSKAACGQNTVGKVTCSYAPKLTLTYCNSNQAHSISPLEMPEKKVKLNGDTENKLKEDIEIMLRSTDFSQWVSAIKSIK